MEKSWGEGEVIKKYLIVFDKKASGALTCIIVSITAAARDHVRSLERVYQITFLHTPNTILYYIYLTI